MKFIAINIGVIVVLVLEYVRSIYNSPFNASKFQNTILDNLRYQIQCFYWWVNFKLLLQHVVNLSWHWKYLVISVGIAIEFFIYFADLFEQLCKLWITKNSSLLKFCDATVLLCRYSHHFTMVWKGIHLRFIVSLNCMLWILSYNFSCWCL